jgi:hypothetical protein
MAQLNYYDSALLGFQSPVRDEYNKAEVREIADQVLENGMDNTKFLMKESNISNIKESVNRPVYGYVLNRKASTLGTAMTAFHTGIGGTSSQQTLTWVAFTEEFYFNETTPYDNVFDKEQLFKNEMSQAMRNIRQRITTWLYQDLYTNRSNALSRGNAALSNLNTATATFEISGNAATLPMSAMTSTLRWNGYSYGAYDFFLDQTLYAGPNGYEFQQAQGAGNLQNLAWQFDATKFPPMGGGYAGNIWESIYLNDTDIPYVGGYNSGAGLCLPPNAFAFIPWMPKIYKDGSGNYEDYAGGYGMVYDDRIPGLEYMVHGWRTQADTTANSGHGYTQDSVTQWQVGVYLAYITQWLSNPGETPIYFFALKP